MLNMLCQFLAYTIHEKTLKAHAKAINLRYQL